MFEKLLGKTIVYIDHIEDGDEGDELIFYTKEDVKYRMFHWQDCCENVYIESIVGDLEDLIGSPILLAEEVEQAGEEDTWGTSTWTFYKLSTIKGSVTIRWFGESNGYYSESVYVEEGEWLLQEENNDP